MGSLGPNGVADRLWLAQFWDSISPQPLFFRAHYLPRPAIFLPGHPCRANGASLYQPGESDSVVGTLGWGLHLSWRKSGKRPAGESVCRPVRSTTFVCGPVNPWRHFFGYDREQRSRQGVARFPPAVDLRRLQIAFGSRSVLPLLAIGPGLTLGHLKRGPSANVLKRSALDRVFVPRVPLPVRHCEARPTQLASVL